MKKMRLFTKTFCYTMLLMSILILLSHMFLYFLMPQVYVDQKTENLDSLLEELTMEMNGQDMETAMESAKRHSEKTDIGISLKTKDVTYVFSTFAMVTSSVQTTTDEVPLEEDEKDKFHLSYSIDSELEKQGSEVSSVFQLNQGLTLHDPSTPISREQEIQLSDGNTVTLMLSMTLQSVSEASDVMISILPYTITISILISFCAAYLYARALTNPIRAICTSTKQMERLDADAVCPIQTQDEIGELAQDINQLYASLQNTIRSLETEIENVSQAEQRKVDFLRSASHELKTPLTSLSVMLENMMLKVGKYKDYEHYLPVCKDMADQLSQMIHSILDTSSMEGLADPGLMTQIKLDACIYELVKPYQLIVKSRKQQMRISLKQPLLLQANQALLEKVLSNVLANAVQYTKDRGNISITLENHLLIIENECEPIAEEHLKHVREAFYRPDFSRAKQTGGNGLGLYFVDQILTMMHLPYTFEPYEKGMRFQIDFTEEA